MKMACSTSLREPLEPVWWVVPFEPWTVVRVALDLTGRVGVAEAPDADKSAWLGRL